MSKVHKCRTCRKRIRRAPFMSIVDKATRKEARWHGGACAQPGLVHAQERGPGAVVLRFAHPRSCGDPKGKMDCGGKCFVVAGLED